MFPRIIEMCMFGYQFSVVTGDPFHVIDCPKISFTKHEAKKLYKVCFRDALLAWNPKKLKEVQDAVKAKD